MRKKRRKIYCGRYSFWYTFNKLILKLDEKYNELANARKKDSPFKCSISKLFIGDYNYNFLYHHYIINKCHPSHH